MVERNTNQNDDGNAGVQNVTAQVRDFAGHAKEAAKDVVSQTTDRVTEAADQAREVADQVRDKGAEAVESILSQVRSEPLLSLLAAAGIGYLIGLLGRR